MPFTTDKKLWLTADKERVVEDGDADAAFLLAAEGDEVSDEDAGRYGLKPPKPKQADAPADKEAPTADKSRAGTAKK